MPSHVIEPLQQQLVQLMGQDGLPMAVCLDLSQKMIEYERNPLFARDVFVNETNGAQRDAGSPWTKQLVANKWQTQLEENLAQIHDKWLKGTPWAEKNMTRLTAQIDQLILRRHKDEGFNSRRYLKRASNQFIKALRQL